MGREGVPMQDRMTEEPSGSPEGGPLLRQKEQAAFQLGKLCVELGLVEEASTRGASLSSLIPESAPVLRQQLLQCFAYLLPPAHAFELRQMASLPASELHARSVVLMESVHSGRVESAFRLSEIANLARFVRPDRLPHYDPDLEILLRGWSRLSFPPDRKVRSAAAALYGLASQGMVSSPVALADIAQALAAYYESSDASNQADQLQERKGDAQ